MDEDVVKTAKAKPVPSAGADRRVDERKPYRSPAAAIAGGQEFPVRTLDISRSGLSIAAAINPPAGLRFRLRIRLDRQPQGAVVMETEVQVMHSVLARQDSGFRIGLRFTNASPDLLRAIANYMGL